jgi:uncharacterized protein YceH (UPF0502 family)
MAKKQTKNIVPETMNLTINATTSRVRNYQRKKVVLKEIKRKVYQSLKNYELNRVVIEPAFNAVVQKYSHRKLPRIYKIVCKFVKDEYTTAYVNLD